MALSHVAVYHLSDASCFFLLGFWYFIAHWPLQGWDDAAEGNMTPTSLSTAPEECEDLPLLNYTHRVCLLVTVGSYTPRFP